MRTIHTIVFHHSANDTDTVEKIREFHTRDKKRGGRGWDDIAYSWLVTMNGNWKVGRDYHRVPASNGFGRNAGTVSICVLGNYEDKRLSPELEKVIADGLVRICKTLLNDGQLVRYLKGHKQLKATACPGKIMESFPEFKYRLSEAGFFVSI